MKTFKYKALKDGNEYENTLEAENKAEVYAHISGEGGTVISVLEKKKNPLVGFLALFGDVKITEKIIFTRTLAAMLHAGLTVSRALSVLERQTKNPTLKSALTKVIADISGGSSFHEALAKHPKIFSDIFVFMVKAGEESGTLADALLVVEKQMERSHTLATKLKGAMIYPSIILFAIGVITVLLLMFVVPTLTGTFKELGVDLPASTQAIVNASEFLKNNSLLSIFILLLIVGGIYYGLKTTKGKKLFGKIILRLPVINQIVRETFTARVSRTLASLLGAGVPVLRALEITKEVIGHHDYKTVLDEAHEKVKKGAPLAESFMNKPHLFPLLMGDMIAVGEETGAVADLLQQVATFYEDEVEQKTENLSTIVEPVLMIIIGVVVGVFAISMITPIYSITGSI